MGNGNIDVGNQTATRKSGRPIVETLAGADRPSGPRIDKANPVSKERPAMTAAMAQQCADSGRGNQSAPQKFLQLVGCRDLKAKSRPWVRPAPVKR